MTDYRTLLMHGTGDWPFAFAEARADAALASPVPWLCPACRGDVGWVDDNLEPCFCTEAPTLADVLRWGERVAGMHYLYRHGGEYNDGWNDLLAELRSGVAQ